MAKRPEFKSVWTGATTPVPAGTVAATGKGEWVKIESIQPAILAAERLIAWFIEDVTGEAINFPITVSVRPFGKRGEDVYGHFTTRPPWSTREGVAVWEVALAAEHLGRDPRQIARTICHEAVHVYNMSRGEKDCAKSGRHNKVFAESAEVFGLTVEKDSKRGYVTPDITDDLWTKIEQHAPIDVAAFDLFHLAWKDLAVEKKVSKTAPWVCKCEGGFKIRVPAKQTLEARCYRCDEDFSQEAS